jgi:pimeloyl-ACP methyl ester carboxylesterase
MMRTVTWLALSTLALAAAACSSKLPAAQVTPLGDAGAAMTPFDTPASACTDTDDSIYGDPGPLAGGDVSARGNIVKCATDADLTKDAMQSTLNGLGYTGKPLTSDARVYRVSYRTERGDAKNTLTVSSALVYVPKTPRATKLPIVVASRGSRGQAAKCAVTKFDPSLGDINDDAYRMIYPLVGHGYVTIVPDLAGYANFGAPGNPPSAYAQAADVAHSTLDGARALQKLFPALDEKLVLVGHSQGGHTALAALALADSYGTPAPIAAVAVYAPLWLSQRSWGAILLPAAGVAYPLATSPGGAVSVWYHYTQAELLDGPGEGRKLFAAGKQDAIDEFVKGECWGSTALNSVGTYAHQLFDQSFIIDVAAAAASGNACGDDRCTKWVSRYTADRPHLTAAAASVPIFLAYGLADDELTPDLMRCAVDRLKADNVKLTACVDQAFGHHTIVSARGDYVADWIGSVALGEPLPAACATNESAITATCPTQPPND